MSKRPRTSGGGHYGHYGDDENNSMMMGRDEGSDLRHDSHHKDQDDDEEEGGEEEDVLLLDEVLGIPGIDTRVTSHPHNHPSSQSHATRGHDAYSPTPTSAQPSSDLALAPLRVRLPFRSAVLPSDGADNPLALAGILSVLYTTKTPYGYKIHF